MSVTVNGVALTDADLKQALPQYADTPNPLRAAVTALVLRRVLLDEATRLGLDLHASDEDGIIDALLARQVQVPEVDVAACRRYYQSYPWRFTVGELVEADHILLQMTPEVSLERLQAHAHTMLSQLQADPSRFDAVARQQSNCASAALGGCLGQLGRGDSVPEFEHAVFALTAPGFVPYVVQTRHGLHIVRVTRRLEGRLRPFEQVHAQIAAVLFAVNRDTAWRQYIKQLVECADVRGIALDTVHDDRVVGSQPC